jgi:tripartite-type tricarboxylate transporter receptor subunit TctC
MSYPPVRAETARRRQLLKAIAGAGMLGCIASVRAQAAWKPTGPIKIVVPYPPGGPADLLARLISAPLSDRFGQAVIVDNRPGATGSLGSDVVYAARPDGNTLLLGVLDPLSIYPHLVRKTSTDVTKFVPVAGIASTALLLMGRPDLPADNLQDLVALARKQSLSYASAGNGSGPHLLTLVFARTAKIDNLLHVPYAGATPGLNALMARQVDIGFVGVGAALGYRSKLKVFGISSANRVPALADVPTLAELGLPVVGESWQGILAPPNTPPAVTAELSRVIQEAVQSQDFRKRVGELGMTTITGTQAEFSKYYLDEYRRWGEVVKVENLKLD